MRAWMLVLVVATGCGGANAPTIAVVDTVDAGRTEATKSEAGVCHRVGCANSCGYRDDGCGAQVYCGPCSQPVPTSTATEPMPEAAAPLMPEAATVDSYVCTPSCFVGCTGGSTSDGCGGTCHLTPNGLCTSACAPAGGSCDTNPAVPDLSCCSGHCGPGGGCL